MLPPTSLAHNHGVSGALWWGTHGGQRPGSRTVPQAAPQPASTPVLPSYQHGAPTKFLPAMTSALLHQRQRGDGRWRKAKVLGYPWFGATLGCGPPLKSPARGAGPRVNSKAAVSAWRSSVSLCHLHIALGCPQAAA